MRRFYLLDLAGNEQDDDLGQIEEFVEGTGFDMKHHHMSLGTPAMPHWPSDAAVQLDPNSGRKLLDLIGVTTHHLTVSSRFVDVLKSVMQPHDDIEFLPVVVKDQRKRVVASNYFIVNPLGTVDCLDLQASDVSWYEKDVPPSILRVKKPVLSDAKLPENPRAIFRIQDSPMDYVLSYRFAAAIIEAKLTNMYWKKLDPV